MENEKLRLKITREDYIEDPRKDHDNAATMVCWHRRYELGDEQPSCEPAEWMADLPEGTVMLPLYLHDHGGLTMSTGDFGDSWDSGQVGWIYIEPETIRKEYSLEADKPISNEDRDTVLALLRSEASVYDTYLRGDVWCYTLERSKTCGSCKNVEWEHVDSCGGMFNGDDMLDHLRDYVPDEGHHLIEQAWEDRE